MSHLMEVYIGPNPAHRVFRENLANAKALGFLLAEENPPMYQLLVDRAAKARSQSPDGRFAIGRPGRATKTSVQLAISLGGNEIDLIAKGGGFRPQLFALVFREAYRTFESFLVDLFVEIVTAEPRLLKSRRKISHEEVLRASEGSGVISALVDARVMELTHGGLSEMEATYDGWKLPLYEDTSRVRGDEMKTVARRIRQASEIRNVLEHNSGVVNAKFLERSPDSSYTLGDRVTIGTAELGDLLTGASIVADHLNQRAVAKFDLSSPP